MCESDEVGYETRRGAGDSIDPAYADLPGSLQVHHDGGHRGDEQHREHHVDVDEHDRQARARLPEADDDLDELDGEQEPGPQPQPQRRGSAPRRRRRARA